MNRSLSSKIAKEPSPAPFPSPAPVTANKKKKKKEQSPRNPLQDLNTSSTISSSNNGSEASSSISVEAPRGCLRFFLSHSSSSSNSKTPICRPKILSKTPKSAPVVKPSRPLKSKDNRSKCNALENPEKLTSRNAHKFKNNSSCLYQWQSGNKPSSRNGQKMKTCSVLNSNGNSRGKFESGSVVEDIVRVVGNPGQPTELKSCGIDENFTSLSKIVTGLGLDSKTVKDEDLQQNSSKSDSRTPPVQASVSPEIQCGSSAVSTATRACYATGHVLSGITDKRKCRPRGILNVEENDSGFSKGKALGSFEDDADDGDDDETGKGVFGNFDAPMVPLPTEASMHWLLSPCNEEDEDHKEHSEKSFQNSVESVNLYSPFSTSGHHGFSLDVCNNANMGSTTNCSRRSTSISPSYQEVLEPLNTDPVLSSPPCTPGCEALTLQDERKYHYDYGGDNSPFSMVSLGSENVIRTPQSHSSMDNQRKHYFDSELSSVAEAIRMASLSPNSNVLVEDQIDSSFQFDCLTTTCNSISRFQKVLDDRASWLSNSTPENVSQSEMRISWREGLVSRIYDMDEYDCCRCLSDEEEDINGCSSDRLKKTCQSPELNINVGKDQILSYNSRSGELLDDEAGAGKVEEGFPSQSSCVCAESISTDGGGLLASGDSDWTLCYKNELFHV
ncbi:hypothetical protein L3X38_040593 [Prunus dulcis]|uniref:Uncharacterized protein n=1 Tax=Prunus dulcis TaxID=3755 RepID=A0AAD4V9D1_PRUDU|nr:hypothetical protein L3X38_040593 [Prunus dulcis]